MHDLVRPRRLAVILAAAALSLTVAACGGGEAAPAADAAGKKGSGQSQSTPGSGPVGCGPIMDTIIDLDMATAEAETKESLPDYKKAVDKAVPALNKLAGEVKDEGELPAKLNELVGELNKVKQASDAAAALKIVEAARENQQSEIAQLCGSA